MPGEGSRGLSEGVGASWPRESREGDVGGELPETGVPERGGTHGVGLGALAGRGEKGPARLWRGLEPEFTLDVIKAGNQGRSLSEAVAAGKGAGLGWAEEGERERKQVVATSLCSHPRWVPNTLGPLVLAH